MFTCWGAIEKNRQASHIKPGPRRVTPCVPMGSLTIPMEFLRPTTVRREYLDQFPFWSARDLERKLVSFQDYYNKDRVHRALDRAPPYEIIANTDRKIARLDDYRWRKRCRGLYPLPVAA